MNFRPGELTYKSKDDLTTPWTGSVEIRVDYWWLRGPEGFLCFRGKPLGNSNMKITEMILKHHPGHELCWLPVVYLPHDCKDYIY